MQSKFSEQLTLALDGIQGSLTHKQVAGKVHVSVGQLSRLKNGTRNTDKPTRISLADALQSIWLNFSGAREDYHIPSFMKNKAKHNDVMAALFQQRKEENERRQFLTLLIYQDSKATALVSDHHKMEPQNLSIGFQGISFEKIAERF